MIPDAIRTSILADDLAAIMRACLALLEMQHPDNSKMAHLHNVNLRAHIRAIADGQNDHEPIPVACIAAAVYELLSAGKSAATIRLVPEVDLLRMAADLGAKIRAYKWTSRPPFPENIPLDIITSNLGRGGDVSTSAPSDRVPSVRYVAPHEKGGGIADSFRDGGYVTRTGFAHLDNADYLPREVAEKYQRKHALTGGQSRININLTVGPFHVDPDVDQKLKDELERYRRGSGAE